MEKNLKVLEYRKRLDRTLASFDLVNEESLKALVKDQILRSSFREIEGDIRNVVEKRTSEVQNFLKMLRSVSGNDSEALKSRGVPHNDWKLKQDNDQLRVMYREGPQGTPFHTLLAEGYVDGPIDVCLCVSWESTLYPKWWPQFTIPPFKVILSTCLKKVRIGEEISLVRMKVPWPLSTREAVVHYFALEYFVGDLVIVLLNTVPDTEHIDINTHGFTRDGIPEPEDSTRIDVVGGFVLQKVSANKSYFRTIATMDIKFDFVPPSIINFISRQLIGNGFKLYQKAVVSAANGTEDFRKALKEPAYVRIREGLESINKLKQGTEVLDSEKSLTHPVEEKTVEAKPSAQPITDQACVTEIEEVDVEPAVSATCPIMERCHISYEIECSATNPVIKQYHVSKEKDDSLTSPIVEPCHVGNGKASISPDVKRALNILDKAIALARGRGHADPLSVHAGEDGMGSTSSWESADSEPITETGWASFDDDEDYVGRDAPENENMAEPSNEVGGESTSDYFSSSQVAPDQTQTVLTPPPVQEFPNLENVTDGGLRSPISRHKKIPNSENVSKGGSAAAAADRSQAPPESHRLGKVHDEAKVNDIHTRTSSNVRDKLKEKKKQRVCCLNLF